MRRTNADFLVKLSAEGVRAVRTLCAVERRMTQAALGKAAGFTESQFCELVAGRRLVDVGDRRTDRLAALLDLPKSRVFDLSALATAGSEDVA